MNLKNWPSTAVSAIALTGRAGWSLDDALAVAYAGRTVTTTVDLVAAVGVDSDGKTIYTGVPAGTRVVVVNILDTGTRGMRVMGRTEDHSHLISGGWGAFTGWLTFGERIRWANRRVAAAVR